GVGFTLVLVTLGGMRELIGQGTLFDQAHLMFGEVARGMTLKIEDFPGMLIAILPPGAFIGLGLLIMVKNLIDKRVVAKATTQTETSEGAAGVTT
ncbi:MAG: electron transport complex subunit RsxE, partial [Candidatus Thiodiazotropha sp. (ex Notomyrtea botanica)]|nr:electron transport complex subunit RsxE [Candidatus Thiodiazotropha sp. (ex Notomyrtea botanica)]